MQLSVSSVYCYLYYIVHLFSCRCQTEPCEECEVQGQTHPVGDRWTSDHCQLCYCQSNLTVQCSPFCPYAARGCPQVISLCSCSYLYTVNHLLLLFQLQWKVLGILDPKWRLHYSLGRLQYPHGQWYIGQCSWDKRSSWSEPEQAFVAGLLRYSHSLCITDTMFQHKNVHQYT